MRDPGRRGGKRNHDHDIVIDGDAAFTQTFCQQGESLKDKRITLLNCPIEAVEMVTAGG
jgi:hypothetical protein